MKTTNATSATTVASKYQFCKVKAEYVYKDGYRCTVPVFNHVDEDGNQSIGYGKPDVQIVKLPVTKGSGFEALVNSGHAMPYVISFIRLGKDVTKQGIIPPEVMLAYETWLARNQIIGDGLLWNNGKNNSGYVLYPKGHHLLEQLFANGLLDKEMHRFAGTKCAEPVEKCTVNAVVVDNNILVAATLDCSPDFGYDLGDGNAWIKQPIYLDGKRLVGAQFRMTNNSTCKGLLVSGHEHFNNVIGLLEQSGAQLPIPKEKIDMILGITTVKFPKAKHMDVIKLGFGDDVYLVSTPDHRRMNKAKVPLSGMVTCPKWFHNMILDFFKAGIIGKGNYQPAIDMVRGTMSGDNDQIRKLLISDKVEAPLLAKVLLGIGPVDSPRVPLLSGTVNDIISTRLPSIWNNRLRKVSGAFTRKCVWDPELEMMERIANKPYGYVKFDGNCCFVGSKSFRDNLGDHDGDNANYLVIAKGWYLEWRNPVAGLPSFAIKCEVEYEKNVPEVLLPYLHNFKESFWTPEVKSKDPLPTTYQGLKDLFAQRVFCASLGAKAIGSISNANSKDFMARHYHDIEVTNEDSAKSGMNQERNGIKAMKSNNQGAFAPTTSPKKIKEMMNFVKGSVVADMDPDILASIETPWNLYTKGCEDYVVHMVDWANKMPQSKFTVAPLVSMAVKTFRGINLKDMLKAKTSDVGELRSRCKTVVYNIKNMKQLDITDTVNHTSIAEDMVDIYRLLTGGANVKDASKFITDISTLSQKIEDAKLSNDPQQQRQEARLELFWYLVKHLLSKTNGKIARLSNGRINYQAYAGMPGIKNLDNRLDLKAHCYSALRVGMKDKLARSCKLVGDKVLVFAHLGSIAFNLNEAGNELVGINLPYTVIDKEMMQALYPIWMSGKCKAGDQTLIDHFDDEGDDGYIDPGHFGDYVDDGFCNEYFPGSIDEDEDNGSEDYEDDGFCDECD